MEGTFTWAHDQACEKHGGVLTFRKVSRPSEKIERIVNRNAEKVTINQIVLFFRFQSFIL